MGRNLQSRPTPWATMLLVAVLLLLVAGHILLGFLSPLLARNISQWSVGGGLVALFMASVLWIGGSVEARKPQRVYRYLGWVGLVAVLCGIAMMLAG